MSCRCLARYLVRVLYNDHGAVARAVVRCIPCFRIRKTRLGILWSKHRCFSGSTLWQWYHWPRKRWIFGFRPCFRCYGDAGVEYVFEQLIRHTHVCNAAFCILLPRPLSEHQRWNNLVSKFPNESMSFHHGMLPLHCAGRSGAPWHVIKWWLDKYADAARTTSSDTGDLPLDWYLSHILVRNKEKQIQRPTNFLGVRVYRKMHYLLRGQR